MQQTQQPASPSGKNSAANAQQADDNILNLAKQVLSQQKASSSKNAASYNDEDVRVLTPHLTNLLKKNNCKCKG